MDKIRNDYMQLEEEPGAIKSLEIFYIRMLVKKQLY
jgi:hypothetical protein